MVVILIFFFALRCGYSQQIDSTINPLHQHNNILKFADYLFCEKDYLRAVDEYLRIDEALRDDKINFKIALSLSAVGDYSSARNIFANVKDNSDYYTSAKLETLKILFLEGKYFELREFIHANHIVSNNAAAQKLSNVSFLKIEDKIPLYEEFVIPFDSSEQIELRELYWLKVNPQYKNPITASFLSALIPGAGKIYTGEISDGIFAFLTTGIFTYLSYSNFNADHKFRGWLFTALAAGFYGGNIYGSYASAQIHNVKFKYDFNLQLDFFLTSKNYFMQRYDFCR